MELLGQDIKDATRKKLEEDMKGKVTLVLFAQEPSVLFIPGRAPGTECQFCRETRQLLEEVQGLSDKIELEVLEFTAHADRAAQYGVDKIPAIVVLGEKDHGIRFFGIPSGYEYTSLIGAVLDASRGTAALAPQTIEALQTLDRDVHIQVFVTPTCPYCSITVRLAHQFAVVSPRIRADMVEATEFPHLVQKYGVRGVPRTIINETTALEGAVPEDVFVAGILEAVSTIKL